MQIGYITSQHLSIFGSLLLPIAVKALEQDEPITTLGLTEDNVACGALAGHLDRGCFQIISFYVAPDYRRRGGGRMLMDALVSLLEQFPGVYDVELNYTQTAPEHESLAPFLTAMGFSQNDALEENLYRTTVGETAASPFFSTKSVPTTGVLSFSQIPDLCLSTADRNLRHDAVPMPELPLTSPELDREVSCALVQNNEVKAFVSFDHSCMGELTLSCAWSGHSSPTVMPALLLYAFHKASERYSPETVLVLQSVTPTATRLLHKLLPTAQPISFTYSRSLSKGGIQ